MDLPVYVSEYLCIKDLLPLWSQVVLDAIDGSIQGDATDEQDGQNKIGECGCEVHHLDTHTDTDNQTMWCNQLERVVFHSKTFQ